MAVANAHANKTPLAFAMAKWLLTLFATMVLKRPNTPENKINSNIEYPIRNSSLKFRYTDSARDTIKKVLDIVAISHP